MELMNFTCSHTSNLGKHVPPGVCSVHVLTSLYVFVCMVRAYRTLCPHFEIVKRLVSRSDTLLLLPWDLLFYTFTSIIAVSHHIQMLSVSYYTLTVCQPLCDAWSQSVCVGVCLPVLRARTHDWITVWLYVQVFMSF